MELGHIVSAGQFSKEQVLEIFETAQQIEGVVKRGQENILISRPDIGILFGQPSTGTINSVHSAARILRGTIPFCYHADTTSAAKGEGITATVRRICVQSPSLGVLFIRHRQESAIQEAVEVADKFGIKIVNCGNGTDEHPTQALTDLYTIWQLRKGILDDELTIVYAPTVRKSRVFNSHSLLFPICCSRLQIIIVAGDKHQIAKPKMEQLMRRVANVDQTILNLEAAAKLADILYVIRPQIEYEDPRTLLETVEKEIAPHTVTQQVLDALPDHAIVMHALPIDEENFRELPREFWDHPQVICFREQSRNKTIIMMALLKMILAPNYHIGVPRPQP